MFGIMQNEIKLVIRKDEKLARYDEALNTALKGIQQTHGIMSASRETGLAYSNICSRINQWESVSGRKLITRTCGLGSELTDYGLNMISCYEKEVMNHGTRTCELPD